MKLCKMEHLVFVIIAVLASTLPTGYAYSHAVFSPHQYQILDGTITFFAKIIEPSHDKFYIHWSETWNPSGPQRQADETMSKDNNYMSNWTLNFSSFEKDRFYPGNYTVLANVMYDWAGIYPVEFATQLIPFTLTEGFTGKMMVNNVTRHRKNKTPFLISTKNATEIKIDVDGNDLLKTATNVSWTWFNNLTNIGNTSEPFLLYNFTEAKTYEITAKVEAIFNYTLNPNATVVKTGNFSSNVTAKVPVTKVNVSGDTWYRNDGRLLRIKITCEGTGPYQYCLFFKGGNYNISGNESCLNPEVTNDCEIPFAWLLGEGIHSLITIIENDLGTYLNKTSIHVYKVARVQPLSLILVPITCSLIALVLIIFGIGYFWENRKRYNVEVADFDFGQHDELPYMTFMERLKDAMSSSALNRQRHIPPPDDHEPIISSRRAS